MADNSVRLARATDASALGEIQSRSWRCLYASLLPQEVLSAVAAQPLAEAWRAAVVSPPSPRHRVLVACEGSAVVGFCAFGPAGDPDLDPDGDAEILAFLVSPDATGRGHGSRLLAATVDFLRMAEFRTTHVWLSAPDADLREFLEGAGWAADGARRELDLDGDGRVLADQSRFTTDLRDE